MFVGLASSLFILRQIIIIVTKANRILDSSRNTRRLRAVGDNCEINIDQNVESCLPVSSAASPSDTSPLPDTN